MRDNGPTRYRTVGVRRQGVPKLVRHMYLDALPHQRKEPVEDYVRYMSPGEIVIELTATLQPGEELRDFRSTSVTRGQNRLTFIIPAFQQLVKFGVVIDVNDVKSIIKRRQFQYCVLVVLFLERLDRGFRPGMVQISAVRAWARPLPLRRPLARGAFTD